METIYIEKPSELKRNIALLEKSLGISINLKGKLATISGLGLEEYEAHIILEAISFGFSVKKSLLLLNPEFQFKRIKIKDFTRKKNLREVKSRIIGTKGKTLRTIENISNSYLILNEKNNEIGLITHADSVEETTTAIQNLIRGTKQSNVYHFLEKQNKAKKQGFDINKK